LLSVDDIVTDLFALLNELNIEKKTFVVYSSDHGYKQGQWRVGTSKQHPYETDIHVPLLFVGPGIPQGVVLPQMTGNVDIMPTLIDLAGGKGNIPPTVDGKSMLPLLLPSQRKPGQLHASDVEWRDAFMIAYKSVGTYYNDHSNCAGNNMGCKGTMPKCPSDGNCNCEEADGVGNGNCYFVDSTHSNSWRNLRIHNAQENLAYIEYDPTFDWITNDTKGGGLQFYELYNITADPYQMTNLYSTTDDATKTRLHQRVVEHYGCKGSWPSNTSTCL